MSDSKDNTTKGIQEEKAADKTSIQTKGEPKKDAAAPAAKRCPGWWSPVVCGQEVPAPAGHAALGGACSPWGTCWSAGARRHLPSLIS